MLFATVSRGRNSGTRLLPHRFKDERYLANGYSLEMSNKAEKHNPTLIRPESIQGWSKAF